MNKWQDEKLITFCQLITKGTTPTSLGKKFTDQGINFIKAESITEAGMFIKENIAHIDESTHQLLRRSALQKDDILFSIAGVIGRVAVVDEAITPANTNQALAIIRLINESAISVAYLKHYLRSDHVLSQFKRISNQLAQANFNLGDLGNLNICAPSLPTQRKIARILSTIDGQIEKTEAIIAKYQAVKQGLLQDLFTRGIDVQTGQLRPRYEDAPELYQPSALGMIPKEWKVKRLQKLCNNVVDCPHSTPTYQDHGVLVARTMHIKKGRYNVEFSSRVPEVEYEERISRLKPQEGDLIFTREAPVGEAFIVPKGMRICLGQRVMLLRPNQNLCLPDFLLETIYSPELQSRLDNMVGGTTAHHVNVADMKNLLLKTPEPDEQKKMVALFQTDRNKMHQEIAALSKLQLLKQGLMQDLLSGKVAVSA